MHDERIRRWRLILGSALDEPLAQATDGVDGPGAPPDAPTPAGDDDERLDRVLTMLYGGAGGVARGGAGGGGDMRGRLIEWLADVRACFDDEDSVTLHLDAVERFRLHALLFEPENLSRVVPSLDSLVVLLTVSRYVTPEQKERIRELVRVVVEELRKRLQGAFEQAVRGALDRSKHDVVPSLPNLDWKRTIETNLKNYVPERRMLVPERFYFFGRRQRRRQWNVILCVDQSGSMAESVVHAAVMSAIFASLPAFETHMVVFDTQVVDLTATCADPVDLIFSVRLGGGTDIAPAVAYCEGLIHDPRKTLFLLISDLCDSGNRARLVQRVGAMVESGVRALCLLGISDGGVPNFDLHLARQLAAVGMSSLACSPVRLPSLIADLLYGRKPADVVIDLDDENQRKVRRTGRGRGRPALD